MNLRLFQPCTSPLLDAFRGLFLHQGKVLSSFVIDESPQAKLALTRTTKKLYLCIDENGDGFQVSEAVEPHEALSFVRRLRSSKGGQGQLGPWHYEIRVENGLELYLKSRFNFGGIVLENKVFLGRSRSISKSGC
ncbi:MAG: hypothetical protein RL095_2712 [Verrucomicrobiota bacterium]